ncbi:MAG: discoidin domain-containing protein [Gemmataceae bacterium]|nr:discoidin domain-containing protein [Gemmataceae bacterium]
MLRFLSLALLLIGFSSANAQPFPFQKGDHVSILGNTLAERMQHHGWMETLIHSRLPGHELSFRNLGFSGDELTLRLRSAGFGSPEDWLKQTNANVVFAFFGYNESFAGEEGLPKFEKDLDSFLKETLSKKYDGKNNPRIVLFSPIAHENIKDPNLPDGTENNKRIDLYTKAMAKVAAANKVFFVDLFTTTLNLYSVSEKPLTINGIHLNEFGDKLVAEIIEKQLFQNDVQKNPVFLDKLRASVLEKDFHWFNRYRTVDGYSIYGGRADLRFVAGQTNRVVMAREMQILDEITANRDKKISAAANGKVLPNDDSNTAPFLEVVTNKPGPLAGGKHIFLDGKDAISKMTIGKGLKVELFASEKEFPDLAKPVQMAFDPKGRLWVAVMPSYPHWKPKEEMNDKILIFEDTDGDGKADKCKVFADRLHVPTGLEFWNGGLLVGHQPDLLFLKDTDGDDVADVRERVLHGIDSADTHHAISSFAYEPGGGLYFQEGTFHHTQVESPYGPPRRCANAGVFRYDPRRQLFDVYASYGFANPHGHAFDRWARQIVTDGTGAVPYDGALFSTKLNFPAKHGQAPTVYKQRTRPCPATEFLTSNHFPEEFQNNYIVPNVIGYQGIMRYKIEEDGGSFKGTELEPILSSSDPSFRPSDIETGPDGALWFLDWQNPIIGHMQHNLRDPSRDRNHGRIYRVTYEGRPLSKQAAIHNEPIPKLLELLKSKEDRVRHRTRLELDTRKSADVVAELAKWIAKLDKTDPDFEHQMMEALWVHQRHNIVNEALLQRMLTSTEPNARACATRVLLQWRDRISDPLEKFKTMAGDEHGRVRMEAIRAASYFDVPEAMEVVFIAMDKPSDVYIDYVRTETLKMLDPIWKDALAKGKDVKIKSEAGSRFLLRSLPVEKLITMEKTKPVCMELMSRPNVRDEVRREALRTLASLDAKTEVRILLDAFVAVDAKSDQVDSSVLFDMVRLLGGRSVGELGSVRVDLEKLATAAKTPLLRQVGFVALVNIDQSIDNTWSLASKSIPSLRDLLAAIPLMPDPNLKALFYSKVEPLLTSLPANLATNAGKAGMGRFVRIELPGKQRTLTLAEVEVISDGINLARKGKATQSTTSNGGDASKAIDGNKSPTFADGGQTHSAEGTDNPWWELDLGSEAVIESIIIYNRADGALGSRLNNFTVKVLDKDKKEVFSKVNNPTPAIKVAFEMSGVDPASLVRKSAMLALASIRGEETKTFNTLSKYVKEGADRNSAINAMQRIPRNAWVKEEAAPLVNALLESIRKVPATERSQQSVLDSIEFTESLASLLPDDQARKVRAELGELGVRVIRLGTLLERMAYDKETLVVKAGKPVEIILENSDLMPHNFVILTPGSLTEIGMQSENDANKPEFQARQFVPNSNKVLAKSGLLQPRETQRISFVAPTKPGVYPYVCTYPGHWRRMYGALYVVADLDAYQANPDAYLASNPLKVEDEVLKDRRPRTEWKFADLSSSTEEMKHGRSFAAGKQMFTVSACISCHKMEGLGQEFGPDLTKLDPKYTKLDLLRHILEPSLKIDEKYQTYIFETKAGKTITGMIVADAPQAITIIENPLAKTPPKEIKKADIESKTKSPVSLMPKGMLDKMTRDEIIDLLAYILAKGDAKNPLFQMDGKHGNH